MTKRNTPDLPGRQTTPFPFRVLDIRGADEGSTLVRVEGEATVYGHEYEVYGGPARGGWIETVAQEAGKVTLGEKPDVAYLINHGGLPVARTKSKTLELRETKSGLWTGADLDTRDTDVSNLLVKMERGDVDEQSFAFRVTQQAWRSTPDFPDDDMAHRTIEAFNLHRGDVSVVTFGANDATHVEIKRSLKFANDAELRELQALIVERLRRSAPDGMSEQQGPGGIPVHVLQLLRL